MINGVHAIVYSKEAEKIRFFFRDVLEWPFVDAGQGWLIFALPPAELGVHPAEANSHEICLMCDDIHSTIEKLKSKGVAISQPVADQGWGLVTQIELPDGTRMGLYQPRHPQPPRA
ncbi:MAG: VOC family protein [Bryobacteraceae bacterium]|jgi:predicted enzyme related to lactoylglutathione lyase